MFTKIQSIWCCSHKYVHSISVCASLTGHLVETPLHTRPQLLGLDKGRHQLQRPRVSELSGLKPQIKNKGIVTECCDISFVVRQLVSWTHTGLSDSISAVGVVLAPFTVGRHAYLATPYTSVLMLARLAIRVCVLLERHCQLCTCRQ